jgi:hypothetical protein
MREYRRGKRKPNGPAAFWLGESLRACGVPWSSGTVALYVCGYESVRWDILEAITRRDTARGAWLWLGHQVEKYIIDELDVADLVLPPFAMLANCWQMIGSEALKWAWGETRTEGFRRRGLAETVRFVLNQKDLTVELRRDIVRDIGRLWAKHHRLEAYTKLFRETIEASEDMSSASR